MTPLSTRVAGATHKRIMYVCEACEPEYCGRFDRKDIAVLKDGQWLCEDCYGDLPISQRSRSFVNMPHPPEYRPAKPALSSSQESPI